MKVLKNRLLDHIKKAGTLAFLLSTFEYKLSWTLDLPFHHNYQCSYVISNSVKQDLMRAVCHQNVIGWNIFLKGYTSQYWTQLYSNSTELSEHHKIPNWGIKMVKNAISLLKQIWDNCNQYLHGTTRSESRLKLRQQIQSLVSQVYASPLRLHHRYPTVCAIPLEQRLQHSTTHLQRWLHRLKHHKRMSWSLLHNELKGQLTLAQAYKVGSHDASSRISWYKILYQGTERSTVCLSGPSFSYLSITSCLCCPL